MNSSSRHPAALPPFLAFLCGALFFYLLRGLRIPGGDTGVVLSDAWASVLWRPGLVYYAREPWCHALVRLFYRFTPDVTSAYILYCAFCGGLFFALLAAYCRQPLFWAVMLCSATTWNFVGHIEYYAPVMVTLLLFLITFSRALEPQPRAKPVHVALAFALSYLFHKLTLFFLPATLWLFFTRRGGRWAKREVAPRQAEWCLGLIILMVLADVLPGLLFNAGIINGLYVTVNEKLLELITPLTPSIARYFETKSITGMFYVYTFGTPAHFAYFFGFLVAGAPLGLALTLWHWRRIRQTPAALALATTTACGLIWTFMWQPRGFWTDWDLFCLAGVPLNFLGAGLALGLWRGTPLPPPSRRQKLASGVCLAVFFGGMAIAAPLIQLGRLQRGRDIETLRDIPFTRHVDAPLAFDRLEAQYHLPLDRVQTRTVYVYAPYGIPFLVSVGADRTILSTQRAH